MVSQAIHTQPAERRQVAALPWRRGADGIEILLVTSRETRRWVTPKGGRMAGRTDAQSAALEALEEAQVLFVLDEAEELPASICGCPPHAWRLTPS